MGKDIIEDSWVYQGILQKGREEVRQEVLCLGRQTLVEIVRLRFPDLLELASAVAAGLTTSCTLNHAILLISVVRDSHQRALQILQAFQTLNELDDSVSDQPV